MSYDNTNKGAIWGNKRKEKETHPDFKGEANIDGVDYWVSAWKRGQDASEKAPALKFSFTKKEEAHKKGVEQAKKAAGDFEPAGPDPFDSFGDDLPF